MGQPKKSAAQFKNAHQAIKESIADIQLNLRTFGRARQPLRELEGKLLAHFGRQDDRFYAFLKEAHPGRPSRKLIEFLRFDLKEMKIRLLFFFDQYPDALPPAMARKFPVEFSEFSSQVLGRIRVEEEYLLPLLERNG